jgi:glutathione S-transferase
MLVLYHGGTSVASAKVRLALAEKGLAFESRLLDLRRGEQKRTDYLAINPAGVVPTLVHYEAVVVESSVILEYIDEIWPAPALMPATAKGRAEIRLWLKRVDDLHEACSILSSSVKLAALRGDPVAVETVLARTPDDAKRQRQKRLIEQGFAPPDIDRAIAAYATFLAAMEATLERQAWLSGDAFGLADCAALPYLHRLTRFGMEAIWTRLPCVTAWLDRSRSRASFGTAVAQWGAEQAYRPSPELAACARRHASAQADA